MAFDQVSKVVPHIFLPVLFQYSERLCGMEVVGISPLYDVNDNTAQLACRVMLDVLGTMVVEGKLGHRGRVMKDC